MTTGSEQVIDRLPDLQFKRALNWIKQCNLNRQKETSEEKP